MKRRRIIWGAALLCGLLLCVLLLRGDRVDRTARYIQQNRTELEAFVAELAAGDASSATYNGWPVCYRPELGMAEFETGASGLVPSSTYWGFYYSPENIPLPVMGAAEMDYVPSGDGWRWEEPAGDNWAGTRRLAEGWFWYEMHF